MIIDATNLVLGRLATVAAKRALGGEQVNIVNCEKAAVTGTKRDVIARYKRKRSMGSVRKGPYFPINPDRVIKRTIRGMLPYKTDKGMKAYKRVLCYIGLPDSLKNEKLETIEGANVSKLDNLNYGSVGKICKELGAKL